MTPQEERTTQKLRFARLHLDELKSQLPPASGSDFERSHHEAFLTQLFGSYNAFLQELNVLLGCGLKEEGVSLGKMRDALKKKNLTSTVLRELFDLDRDSNSWFRQAKDYRDRIMHISGIPLAFHLGGPKDGKVAIINPQTRVEYQDDVEDTFTSWFLSTEQLISW